VEIDCFKDGENDFMKHGSAMVVMWRFMVMEMFPNVMRWFKIGMMNPTGDKFFQKLAEGLIKQRQNSTVDHNDVMHSLVKASKEDPELVTTKMMMLTIAQFFTDGYWTYTEVFTGIMYMIAVHPEVQEKIHEELDCVLGEKKRCHRGRSERNGLFGAGAFRGPEIHGASQHLSLLHQDVQDP